MHLRGTAEKKQDQQDYGEGVQSPSGEGVIDVGPKIIQVVGQPGPADACGDNRTDAERRRPNCANASRLLWKDNKLCLC